MTTARPWYVVRAEGRPWARVVKLDGGHSQSAYSTVPLIRGFLNPGNAYQPLRKGDVVHDAPRQVVEWKGGA